MDTEKENRSDAADIAEDSWARGLILPGYFLVLLAIGIWLFSGANVPGAIMVAYALVLIASIAALFFRKITFAFDRRNYIDMSRSQWFGRRGRSPSEDS